MIRRLTSIIRKEAIHIVRDRRTLALSFVMPIVMLLLLGFAANTDVRNISLVVVDQDRSPASRALVDAFRAADYFRVDYEADSEAQIEPLIGQGAARAGLIVPPGYGDQLAAGRTAQVGFVLDGSDPIVAQNALASATLIGQAKATEIALQRLAARGQTELFAAPVQIRTRVWYNPDLVSAYYMVPALIGIILLFQSLVLTSTAIVRERERGTIEQLIVTPIRSGELIVGKIVPYVVIAFVNIVEVLLIGALLFRVPMNGSVLLLLALAALFMTTTLGIGLLISTIARTQQEAMITAIFYILPNIFLAGFFFPIAAMPPVLQLISYLFPLRYFLIIVRGIVLKGVGLEALLPEVIGLTIFGLVVVMAASRRFHKSLD
jgi:drug efflux transport system permease protein